MKDNIYIDIMLKKYEHLHSRYLDTIKNKQRYLYVTLFTSAFYVLIVQFYFRYEISLRFFPIILFPSIMILALWIQNFLFFLPFGYSKNIEYDFYEKMSFKVEKLTTDKELIKIFNDEFADLYRSIIWNSRGIKIYQMFLTITWLVLIISTVFPLFFRAYY